MNKKHKGVSIPTIELGFDKIWLENAPKQHNSSKISQLQVSCCLRMRE